MFLKTGASPVIQINELKQVIEELKFEDEEHKSK